MCDAEMFNLLSYAVGSAIVFAGLLVGNHVGRRRDN